MALPSSGPLSINDIRNALGTGNGSLRYLSSLAGKSTPDAISEFYGYSPTHDVYINFYYPSYVGCYNYYYFAATSNEALSTSLTITMYWYGDLGGAFNGSVTINSGASCGSNSYVYSGGVYCGGEYYSSNNYYFSPNSYGSQNYVGNQVYLDLYPC